MKIWEESQLMKNALYQVWKDSSMLLFSFMKLPITTQIEFLTEVWLSGGMYHLLSLKGLCNDHSTMMDKDLETIF